MAVYYSDQFIGDGVGETQFPEPSVKKNAGLASPVLHKYICSFNTAAGFYSQGDKIRLLTIPSAARLCNIFSFCGSNDNGVFDIGFYKSGLKNDGPELDGNCIRDAWSVGTFTRDLQLMHLNSGQGAVISLAGHPCWQIINAGGVKSYSEDPRIDFDIVLECMTANTVRNIITLHVDVVLNT